MDHPRTTPRARFADLGVRTKVLTAVAVAAVVALVVGVLGLSALSASAATSQRLYDQNLGRIESLGLMLDDVEQLRIAVRDSALSPDPAAVDTALSRVSALLDDYSAAEADYRADGTTAAEEQLLGTADAALTAAVARVDDELAPLARSGDDTAWIAAEDADVSPLTDQVVTALDQLRTAEETDARQAAADARTAYEHHRLLSLAVLAAGLATAVAVGRAVAAGIARGLRRVQDVTESLAAGDLTATAGLSSRDELGRMGSSLDEAMAGLRTVMGSVVGSAESVAAAAEALSASATQIAASAEETSTQSAVVSAAAEEVSRSVQTVAAGAEEMGASIHEIAQNASQAARVAADAVAETERTDTTMRSLNASSQEVDEVVRVITSIAAQTHLLALNATIEAARAGDAGTGFAVVATEVKELAAETARATEDIGRRVQAIQADSARAVDAIGHIGGVIGQISDHQLTIASAVEEQTATTDEMSRSVQEAAGGSTEIARNITGVSTAAESTTQALSQTRVAVDELSRMASGLRASVARFTY